ncbi:tetraspanin pls1 family [Moniliophthora roreri]|nr:tetraspanin pls1 family [Moniliophthora roreri]
MKPVVGSRIRRAVHAFAIFRLPNVWLFWWIDAHCATYEVRGCR